MYCKHCGAEIEEGCKYCRFCGMSVVTLEKMTGDEHIDAIPDAEAEKAMRKRKAGTRAVAILGTFGAVFAAPCAIAGFVMALIALIIAGRQKRKYGSVATAAKVCGSMPGVMRSSTFCTISRLAASRSIAISSSALSTTKCPMPCSIANAMSASVLLLE